MSWDVANDRSFGLFILSLKTGGLMKNSPYSGVRFEKLCKTAKDEPAFLLDKHAIQNSFRICNYCKDNG
jgi:hypothetical protein